MPTMVSEVWRRLRRRARSAEVRADGMYMLTALHHRGHGGKEVENPCFLCSSLCVLRVPRGGELADRGARRSMALVADDPAIPEAHDPRRVLSDLRLVRDQH